MAALPVSFRGRQATADDVVAEHADGVRQLVLARPGHEPGLQGRGGHGAQLDELFADADTKAVIFSQWLRMHELLVREFEKKEWNHVFFHGGVPSNKRKDLVDKFREDPKCRLFLATDAGGVGLNLQHASVVVNMDLPWNPAVLEQRIGRVHRLGQRRVVQVINFVARGTIEEGMLSVLKFKKSLFAGVLDGGEKDIMLGGSRLTKFMETVEQTTQAAQTAKEHDTDGMPPIERSPGADRKRSAGGGAGGAPTGGDPWSGLVQTGLAFLQNLATVAGASRGGSESAAATGSEGSGASFRRPRRQDGRDLHSSCRCRAQMRYSNC